jgi:protein-S-isoprenylcysteine O-methyltransferase Ste14
LRLAHGELNRHPRAFLYTITLVHQETNFHTMIWRFLFPGLWLAWIAYWLISAAGNKATVRRESLRSRLGYMPPLWLGLFLLIHQRWQIGWLIERVVQPAVLFVPLGALLLVLGLGFSVWARVHLGGNWSAIVTLKKDHELIRTGPYRWVRHPIYTGLLLGILGSAIALGQWRGLLALACMTFGFIRKIHLEERWLGEAFSPRYDLYKKEVSALIPGIY